MISKNVGSASWAKKSDRTQEATTKPPIQWGMNKLPPELWQQCIDKLDFETQLRVSHANRALRSIAELSDAFRLAREDRFRKPALSDVLRKSTAAPCHLLRSMKRVDLFCVPEKIARPEMLSCALEASDSVEHLVLHTTWLRRPFLEALTKGLERHPHLKKITVSDRADYSIDRYWRKEYPPSENLYDFYYWLTSMAKRQGLIFHFRANLKSDAFFAAFEPAVFSLNGFVELAFVVPKYVPSYQVEQSSKSLISMDNLKVLSIESDAHFTRDGVNTAQNLRFYLQAASKKTTGLDLLDLSVYAAYHEGRQHSGGVTAAQIVSEFLPRLSNIKTLICPITFFGSVENKEHLAILRSSVNPMVPLADEYLSDERNAHENMSCPQSIYNYADRRSGVRGLARRWVNRTI